MKRSSRHMAIPPGETMKELLDDRRMSRKDFAAGMGMPEELVGKLINGGVPLTPETAVRLEMVFGVPAGFWNKLEAVYRDKIIKVDAENSTEEKAERTPS